MTAQVLTFSFSEQRDGYLQLGFGSWSKRDFNAFIKGSEKFGRGDIRSIAAEIEGKTVGEVTEYHTVSLKPNEFLKSRKKMKTNFRYFGTVTKKSRIMSG